MKYPFSIMDTPISLPEFCVLADITATEYLNDLSLGLISRTCNPFLDSRSNFIFSSFVDLFAYCLQKKYLPENWTSLARYEIAEGVVDTVLLRYEWEEELNDFEELADFVEKNLDLDCLYDALRRDGIYIGDIIQILVSIARKSVECWAHYSLKFKELLEAQINSSISPAKTQMQVHIKETDAKGICAR
ncbi:MAG: hypothetical protein QNJ09_00650 [Paracoccaceae bacterium]|nr:hypothetical protein [Paracoccaceae bacterium]